MAKAVKEENKVATSEPTKEEVKEQQTAHDEQVVATYGSRNYESNPVVLDEANKKAKNSK